MKTYALFGYTFTEEELDNDKFVNPSDEKKKAAFERCQYQLKIDRMPEKERNQFLKNKRDFQKRMNSEAGL